MLKYLNFQQIFFVDFKNNQEKFFMYIIYKSLIFWNNIFNVKYTN